MYQSGTKPQPPMKSGELCACVAAMTMSLASTPSDSRLRAAAVICLVPQSPHFLP